MKDLYNHLQANADIKPYIGDYDLHEMGYIELTAPNNFGLSIIAENDGYGRSTGLYSVTTFYNTGTERILGHLTTILDYYWYNDCSPESVVELFEEIMQLAPRNV